MTLSTRARKTAAALLLLGCAGCADLAITNPNEPDRDRALKNGGDIQALVVGTFRTWWGLQQGVQAPSLTNLAAGLAAAADEIAADGLGGPGNAGFEPREPVVNVANDRWGGWSTDSWFRLSRGLAAIRDGIQSVEGGVDIGTNGADEPRFLAFSRLMQGLALGHLALVYDQVFILDEKTADPREVKLIPYAEGMGQARKYLDEAAELAGKSTFTIPAGWMGTTGFSNQDLVRIAHSYQARFMVQVARTPQERAAVDWNAVLTHVQQGVTRDFGVQLDGPGGKWESPLKSSNNERMRLPYVGPADQSGGWQKWEASATVDKFPFLIDTDDRRVTGGTGDSSGSLIEYQADQTADPTRGYRNFSNYTSKKWAQIYTSRLGFAADLTVQEMQYLAAEAYIRTNRPELALPIINKTRVENGKLPPATVAGVSGARCVPRTEKGACGNLLQTLAWEKQIELPLMYAGSNYFDKRGYGTLRKGTILHLPVPAKDLEALKLPVYTFGGSSPGSAPGI